MFYVATVASGSASRDLAFATTLLPGGTASAANEQTLPSLIRDRVILRTQNPNVFVLFFCCSMRVNTIPRDNHEISRLLLS